MRSSLFALAASIASASAASQGFNYGSTKPDGSFMLQADFQSQFETAKSLVGASGFTSARLYTMVQGGASTPTEAIPAAISAGTTLLLGMWASGGQGSMTAEINALKSAITTYGTSFTSIVTGISVGSEDLYRNSPTGIAAGSNVGAEPETIVNYIAQVRAAIAGTGLSGVGIGHVDTWTAWNNGSNQDVVSHVDWVGVDAYPYFQNTEDNSIEQGAALFQSAMDATTNMAQGKPVWITETGWPVSGPTEGSGVPSLQNAKAYWDAVGCPRFGGNTNIYWFTLTDSPQASTSPSFGIVGPSSSTPLYDLSCSNVTPASSSSSVAKPQTSSITGGESTSPVPTSAVVTGGGLSPTVGNGIGSQSIVSGTTASVPTGSAESASGSATPSPSSPDTKSGSGSTFSTSSTTSAAAVSTTDTSNSSVTAKTTAPTSSTFNGGGAQATGSFFGLVGAAIALAAAL